MGISPLFNIFFPGNYGELDTLSSSIITSTWWMGLLS